MVGQRCMLRDVSQNCEWDDPQEDVGHKRADVGLRNMALGISVRADEPFRDTPTRLGAEYSSISSLPMLHYLASSLIEDGWLGSPLPRITTVIRMLELKAPFSLSASLVFSLSNLIQPEYLLRLT
jgi:hypothetical protein